MSPVADFSEANFTGAKIISRILVGSGVAPGKPMGLLSPTPKTIANRPVSDSRAALRFRHS